MGYGRRKGCCDGFDGSGCGCDGRFGGWWIWIIIIIIVLCCLCGGF